MGMSWESWLGWRLESPTSCPLQSLHISIHISKNINQNHPYPAKKLDPKDQAVKDAKTGKSGSTTLKKRATKKIRTKVTFHQPKTLKKNRNPKYPPITAPARNIIDHYISYLSIALLRICDEED
ncbi:hypothetical protein M9H77_17267 [Catharanthus roseus]|uniref:Uncharacterized protein n=1 Tax=Catharanthus roseus TaxID=4058 RepID=A0ACC0B438_CATRO|nr:hypothetical protein M9H77_17267 [Catharanthus roseus]